MKTQILELVTYSPPHDFTNSEFSIFDQFSNGFCLIYFLLGFFSRKNVVNGEQIRENM